MRFFSSVNVITKGIFLFNVPLIILQTVVSKRRHRRFHHVFRAVPADETVHDCEYILWAMRMSFFCGLLSFR